jgi:uncharacterized membrane protein HdeD (DUF308 family)
MLMTLASHWKLLLFRGALGLLFGAAALLWPGLTLVALVLLFGSFALVDGVAALVTAFAARGRRGFGGLLLEAFFGIAAGIVTFLYPGLSTLALLIVIASWAIVTGAAVLAVSVALRAELEGQWPLPLSGALSMLLGILLLVQPQAGAVALAWMIGLYAIIAGFALMILALRLRQLRHEMAHA